jgi:hypothetical protein
MSDLPDKWHEMSVGALWDALNNPRRYKGAARSTYDALLFELSRFGIERLATPKCQQRLGDLSTDQVRELIGALIRLKSKYRTITDDLLLKLGDQLS